MTGIENLIVMVLKLCMDNLWNVLIRSVLKEAQNHHQIPRVNMCLSLVINANTKLVTAAEGWPIISVQQSVISTDEQCF